MQIHDQRVEVGQHLGRWLAGFAVKRIHRHVKGRMARMVGFDHVVLDVGPETVLRAEQRRQ